MLKYLFCLLLILNCSTLTVEQCKKEIFVTAFINKEENVRYTWHVWFRENSQSFEFPVLIIDDLDEQGFFEYKFKPIETYDTIKIYMHYWYRLENSDILYEYRDTIFTTTDSLWDISCKPIYGSDLIKN